MANALACGTETQMSGLSFFTGSVSILLFVLSAGLNFVVAVAILKDRRRLFRRIFYMIIFNLCLCDGLTGLITAGFASLYHFEEGLGIIKGRRYTEVLEHYFFFALSGESVLSIILICLDRLYALYKPLLYRTFYQRWRIIIVVMISWLISLLVSIAYFWFGYIRFLGIFTASTVSLTMVLLQFTFLVYRRKFYHQVTPQRGRDNDISTSGCTRAYGTCLSDGRNTACHSELKEYLLLDFQERRILQTLLVVLFLFFLNYIPPCIMILFLNTCTNCSCVLVHVLRDLTLLTIISSSLFRPVTFLLRLNFLRSSVTRLLCPQQRDVVRLQSMR